MTPASMSNWERFDGGNAVLPAEQRRDLFVFREAELHEVVAELAPVGLLVLEGFLELCRGNALLFEQQLAYSNSHDLPALVET